MSRFLITFFGARDAARACKLLELASIKISVTAVPEDISSECGIALYLRPEDLGPAKELLTQNGIENKIYDR